MRQRRPPSELCPRRWRSPPLGLGLRLHHPRGPRGRHRVFGGWLRLRRLRLFHRPGGHSCRCPRPSPCTGRRPSAATPAAGPPAASATAFVSGAFRTAPAGPALPPAHWLQPDARPSRLGTALPDNEDLHASL